MNKGYLFLLTLLVSSCIQDPNGFLRKSPNNKYFDQKSVYNSKRMPAYNMKHIEIAKRNMYSNSYDTEDAEDEFESPELYHREIYKQMVIEEEKNKKSISRKKSKKQRNPKKHGKDESSETENMSYAVPKISYNDDLLLDEVIESNPKKQISYANEEFEAEKERLNSEISNMKIILDAIKSEMSSIKNKSKIKSDKKTFKEESETEENSNEQLDQSHILLNAQYKAPKAKIESQKETKEIVAKEDKITDLYNQDENILLNNQYKAPKAKVESQKETKEIVAKEDKISNLFGQNEHAVLNNQYISRPISTKKHIIKQKMYLIH